MKPNIVGEMSDKEQRECDLTSLTDSELNDNIDRISCTINVFGDLLADRGDKLRLDLFKYLNEQKRREYLAKFREYLVGEKSEKEQRECNRGRDLTSLTEVELHAKIHKTSHAISFFEDELPDRGDNLRRDLMEHLIEKKGRLDLAEVSINVEYPKSKFFFLLE
ncbi:hypothetical protein SUGI_0262420 [Cryptomeria japonica]|nr:hypothetical protein SUGI_0262420 [Cryptomeria japonica]